VEYISMTTMNIFLYVAYFSSYHKNILKLHIIQESYNKKLKLSKFVNNGSLQKQNDHAGI